MRHSVKRKPQFWFLNKHNTNAKWCCCNVGVVMFCKVNPFSKNSACDTISIFESKAGFHYQKLMQPVANPTTIAWNPLVIPGILEPSLVFEQAISNLLLPLLNTAPSPKTEKFVKYSQTHVESAPTRDILGSEPIINFLLTSKMQLGVDAGTWNEALTSYSFPFSIAKSKSIQPRFIHPHGIRYMN